MNTNTNTTQDNARAAGCRYYVDYVYNTEYGRKYWYFVFVRTSDGAILYANKGYNAVREYGRDMGINARYIWDFSHNA